MYDAAIIGGGPSGSQVAYRLSTMGHKVVVVERKESIEEPVCCTGIIGQECIESYNIDKSLILRQASRATVFSPSGRAITMRRNQPQASIVDRASFNSALAARAGETGAEYLLSSPVRAIDVAENSVKIRLGNNGKDTGVVEARAAVITTGSGAGLVQGLGLNGHGDYVAGAQAEVETDGLDGIEVYSGKEVAPGFFAWLVPTSPQRALAGLLARNSPGFYLKRFLSFLSGRSKIVSADVKISYGSIPLKPISRTYSDRLLVAGSAAGQVKPTTGGGVYYGLICADIAAEHLHRALAEDNLATENLAEYEKAWKKRLGHELRAGYWAHKFYERLNDAQIDRIFELITTNGIDRDLFADERISFDWHGTAAWNLLKRLTLSGTIEAMKIPFTFGPGSEYNNNSVRGGTFIDG